MVQHIILQSGNKKYIRNIPNINDNDNDNDNTDNTNNTNTNTNNKNSFTIKELFNDILDTDYNFKNNNYFFIKDGKLLSYDDDIYITNTYTNTDTNTIVIECFRKVKGGFGIMDILNAVLDAVLAVFNPIVNPIIMIGNIFLFLIDLLLWFVKFCVWLVRFVFWLFTDLLNPINFTSDFFHSIMVIIITIFSSIFNVLTALVALAANTVGSWVQGFWGWDMSNLTKNDKNSNYFQKFDRTKGQKSYMSSSNTVPFSIILGTILCPPMGVFMDLGITGWFNIFICCMLTLLFYIPGLCYALLIIYS